MTRTLFFDFGNVIGFFDHARALARLAPHTDMPPTELALILYGGALIDDYEHGRIDTAEYVREALLNGRLRCSAEEFGSAFADIFWPNPEVIEMIPRLKPRYRLVLASNTCAAHYAQFRAAFADTLSHFDALGASHALSARKPHEAFFRAAHELAAAEPAECLFVDDLPVNVEAARRFGWQGLVYAPGGNLERNLRAAGVEFG